MLNRIRVATITPAIVRWLRKSRTSWRTLSTPSGPPEAHAPGPDPDRILLFGAGISMGYGMASHDRALPGQIARQVARLTGRGVRVDLVAGDHLTLENALATFTVSRLREFDVVITTPGTLENLLLMPIPVWRAHLRVLLDHFESSAPASLRVLFIAVPELTGIVRMPRLLGWVADRWARRLNRALEEECGKRDFATFVPFRPTGISGRDGTGRTYEQWATLIAPSVADAVQEHERASR